METLIGLLPFAIVALACPLLMIFMMRGMHGGQSGHSQPACHPAQDRTAEADGQTGTRLQAMEQEITELRRELAEAKDAQQTAISRNGGRA